MWGFRMSISFSNHISIWLLHAVNKTRSAALFNLLKTCCIRNYIFIRITNISMVTYLTNTIWKALKKLTWLGQVVHSGTPCPHHYWWHLSLGLGASEPSYPRYLLEDFSRNLPLPLLKSYPLHWDIFAAEIKVSANPNKPNQNETMSFINIIFKINTIWEFIFQRRIQEKTITFEIFVNVFFWIGGIGAFSTHCLNFSWHSAWVYFGAFSAFRLAAIWALRIFSSFFFFAALYKSKIQTLSK